MAHNGNDLTTNTELLDQLVTAASRGNRIALEALEVRYGIVVMAAVRARVFKEQHRFINSRLAWDAAAKAIRYIAERAPTSTQSAFLAWLGLAADEAAGMDSTSIADIIEDDGLQDADRCALELYVMGYGSTQIGDVLGEPKTMVKERIENAKQLMLARAMAANLE